MSLLLEKGESFSADTTSYWYPYLGVYRKIVT